MIQKRTHPPPPFYKFLLGVYVLQDGGLLWIPLAKRSHPRGMLLGLDSIILSAGFKKRSFQAGLCPLDYVVWFYVYFIIYY